MHYTVSDVLNDGNWGTVTLREGDTADNPASTKRKIHGPAVVEYTRHPDGGIDAKVR